jgi:hypothetical protein
MHNTTEIAKLVDIYAKINRMRVLSPPKVIAAADNALQMIIATGGGCRTMDRG